MSDQICTNQTLTSRTRSSLPGCWWMRNDLRQAASPMVRGGSDGETTRWTILGTKYSSPCKSSSLYQVHLHNNNYNL